MARFTLSTIIGVFLIFFAVSTADARYYNQSVYKQPQFRCHDYDYRGNCVNYTYQTRTSYPYKYRTERVPYYPHFNKQVRAYDRSIYQEHYRKLYGGHQQHQKHNYRYSHNDDDDDRYSDPSYSDDFYRNLHYSTRYYRPHMNQYSQY